MRGCGALLQAPWQQHWEEEREISGSIQPPPTQEILAWAAATAGVDSKPAYPTAFQGDISKVWLMAVGLAGVKMPKSGGHAWTGKWKPKVCVHTWTGSPRCLTRCCLLWGCLTSVWVSPCAFPPLLLSCQQTEIKTWHISHAYADLFSVTAFKISSIAKHYCVTYWNNLGLKMNSKHN